MRQLQVWLAQHEIAVEKNVEIDLARAIALRAAALSPERPLDLEQTCEERRRRELRRRPHDLVEIAPLRLRPPGFGFID